MKSLLSFSIQPPPFFTEIVIGNSLLEEAVSFSKNLGDPLVVLTTKEVARLLNPLDFEHLLVLPSGEAIKTRAIKEKVENFLIKKGAGRGSCLLAIGGGSLLDLAGFVASTYCRGISYVSLPTTLLAMTDACLGGKTGLNVRVAKNWIGTFYFPKKIFIDCRFLNSLPEREYHFGLAESVKHSLIANFPFFEFLEKNWKSVLAKEPDYLYRLIYESLAIKKRIVEEDPFELNGKRRILNFGHTVAHALEAHSHYSMSHGEAVFAGMLVESALSFVKGFLSKEHFVRIQNFYKKTSFPIQLPLHIPYHFMKRDKKGAFCFVALEQIGKAMHFDGRFVVKLEENDFKKGWERACCDC